ncbi:hypothetical protein [Nocardioides sp.]|uniref:hypothetical protein n=1 Tax=Nocardioides sp. TaxID=35761 RepID=UPI002BC3FA21|nr:hypothetical protein [Nocardioides sp.]HXH79501.1 hypothetical protein [Nocardioides sp.]
MANNGSSSAGADNLRRGGRTAIQGAVASVIVEAIERNDWHQFAGLEEALAITAIIGIVAWVQNQLEDLAGYRIFDPKDRKVGAVELNRPT